MRIGVDTTFLVQVSIEEHPGHARALDELTGRIAAGDTLALAPQVVTEFAHIVTDARRFAQPLSMTAALERARHWWHARETEQVFPTSDSVALFVEWMQEFRLGRKRLLDTLLAATLFTGGVRTILSTNARDYSTFGCFSVVDPGC